MGLAQGHSAVMPVRLKPAAPLSRVKHSTTVLPPHAFSMYRMQWRATSLCGYSEIELAWIQ